MSNATLLSLELRVRRSKANRALHLRIMESDRYVVMLVMNLLYRESGVTCRKRICVLGRVSKVR